MLKIGFLDGVGGLIKIVILKTLGYRKLKHFLLDLRGTIDAYGFWVAQYFLSQFYVDPTFRPIFSSIILT